MKTKSYPGENTFIPHEGIYDRRFNKFVAKNTNNKGYPPENYSLNLRIPMDVAVKALKRYESEPLRWEALKKPVKFQEVIIQLLFLWGSKELKGDIFRPYYHNAVVPYRKRSRRAQNDLATNQPEHGRKRRRSSQVDIFQQGTEDPKGPTKPNNTKQKGAASETSKTDLA